MRTVFIVLVAIVCFNCSSPQNTAIQKVTVHQVDSLIQQNIQIIDVRTREEYQVGHLKEAVNIDIRDQDFEKNILGLKKDTPVLLYCAKGGRSAKASKLMQKLGFSKLYDLKGGFKNWVAKNKPFEK